MIAFKKLWQSSHRWNEGLEGKSESNATANYAVWACMWEVHYLNELTGILTSNHLTKAGSNKIMPNLTSWKLTSSHHWFYNTLIFGIGQRILSQDFLRVGIRDKTPVDHVLLTHSRAWGCWYGPKARFSVAAPHTQALNLLPSAPHF